MEIRKGHEAKDIAKMKLEYTESVEVRTRDGAYHRDRIGYFCHITPKGGRIVLAREFGTRRGLSDPIFIDTRHIVNIARSRRE